jgi:hypothetical protein
VRAPRGLYRARRRRPRSWPHAHLGC